MTEEVCVQDEVGAQHSEQGNTPLWYVVQEEENKKTESKVESQCWCSSSQNIPSQQCWQLSPHCHRLLLAPSRHHPLSKASSQTAGIWSNFIFCQWLHLHITCVLRMLQYHPNCKTALKLIAKGGSMFQDNDSAMWTSKYYLHFHT